MLRKSTALLILSSFCVCSALFSQEAFQIEFRTSFHLLGPVPFVKYTLLLPQDIMGKQQVNEMSFSPQPNRIYEKNGNQYAEFRVLRPREDFEVSLRLDVSISPAWIFDTKMLSPFFESHVDLNSFLEPGPFQESEDPRIQGLSVLLKQKDTLETIRAIHQFVRDTLQYEEELEEDIGAVNALMIGQGDCSEFADLFVCLCRASGIPARTVSGWLLDPDIENPNHHWAEVWLQNKWIPIDPSSNRGNLLSIQSPSFSYLFLSPYRIDRVCKTSNNRWVATGKIDASYQYSIQQKGSRQ